MKKIAILLIACAAPVSAASLFLESFSTDNNDQGWFQVSTASSVFLAQNPTTDALDFGGTDYSTFYVVADSLSSGGAFSGNYSAAGIFAMQFDLTLGLGSSVTAIFFEITNLTEGETWQYALPVPTLGDTTSFVVPLGSSIGWTQTSGDENFAFILGQTEEIGIGFTSSPNGNLTAALDNVASVPEPSALVFTGVAGLIAAARRRRID